jgi:hypothetical protein
MSELKPGGAPVFDAARHLDALAPALGLTISAGQRPGVLQFLATAQAMAELVATAPLDDGACELAPVFRPGSPGDGA